MKEITKMKEYLMGFAIIFLGFILFIGLTLWQYERLFSPAEKIMSVGTMAAPSNFKSIEKQLGFLHKYFNARWNTDNVKKYSTIEMLRRFWIYDNKHGTFYFNKKNRQKYKIIIKNNKIYDRWGSLINPIDLSGYDSEEDSDIDEDPDGDFGEIIYTMDGDGEIYMYQSTTNCFFECFHHSSFVAGGPVASAGILKILNGRITNIINNSGHYSVSFGMFVQVVDELIGRGYRFESTRISDYGNSRNSGVDLMITTKSNKENVIVDLSWRHLLEMQLKLSA